MKLLLTLLLAIQTIVTFSQVHVRGYTRKDGTYVRPHTRSSPGSGSSSSTYNSSSVSSNDYSPGGGRNITVKVDGHETTLSNKDFKDGWYKAGPTLAFYKPKSYLDDIVPVYEASTDLKSFTPVKTKKKRLFKTTEEKAEVSTMVYDTSGVPVYLSVIRVNGKVADIVAFPRSILNEQTVDFSHTMYHVLDKSLFTAEQSLELIDKYGFKSEQGILKTSINVSYGNTKLPDYINHKVEVMRLR